MCKNCGLIKTIGRISKENEKGSGAGGQFSIMKNNKWEFGYNEIMPKWKMFSNKRIGGVLLRVEPPHMCCFESDRDQDWHVLEAAQCLKFPGPWTEYCGGNNLVFVHIPQGEAGTNAPLQKKWLASASN